MPNKRSRKHEVRALLTVPNLAKAGSSLNLELYDRDEKIGELVIGRGSLFWYGRKRQSSKRIPWSRFADLMETSRTADSPARQPHKQIGPCRSLAILSGAFTARTVTTSATRRLSRCWLGGSRVTSTRPEPLWPRRPEPDRSRVLMDASGRKPSPL